MGIVRASEFGTRETFYWSHSKRGVYTCGDSLGPGADSCAKAQADGKALSAEAKLERILQHSGGIMARGSSTLAKREREKALQKARQEKEAKRANRKAEKASRRPGSDGEDPDLAGLRWGPQEPLYWERCSRTGQECLRRVEEASALQSVPPFLNLTEHPASQDGGSVWWGEAVSGLSGVPRPMGARTIERRWSLSRLLLPSRQGE